MLVEDFEVEEAKEEAPVALNQDSESARRTMSEPSINDTNKTSLVSSSPLSPQPFTPNHQDVNSSLLNDSKFLALAEEAEDERVLPITLHSPSVFADKQASSDPKIQQMIDKHEKVRSFCVRFSSQHRSALLHLLCVCFCAWQVLHDMREFYQTEILKLQQVCRLLLLVSIRCFFFIVMVISSSLLVGCVAIFLPDKIVGRSDNNQPESRAPHSANFVGK
jgi:hypothetical protein